jgi:adenosylcobinamide-GDP ribazoletransferase
MVLCETEPAHNDRAMPDRSAIYDMLRGWCADFLASVAFLTRLPLPVDLPRVPLAQAMRAFPIVGALTGTAIGALTAFLHWLGLPSLVAAGLGIAALVLLTGALHEDGLADVADGFGGGEDRARKLEIMRDSRIGTYGVVAVGLILLIRAACLADLTATAWLPICSMAAAGALSRSLAVWLLASTDPARGDGVSASAGRPESGVLSAALIAGAILAAVFLFLAVGVLGSLIIMLAGAAAAVIIRLLALWQIDGHTGDVCGALIIVSETAMLTAASIFA